MASRALFGLIRRHPVWADASDPTLALLADASRVFDRSPGQVFVVEGETANAIFLLTSGAARIYYPARKSRPEVTVKLMLAPGAFGDIACVGRKAYTATVEALTSASALAIDARAYFTAMQREPRACFRQYWDVARRFGSAVEMERAAYVTTVVERVVALLLAYAEQGGGEIALSQDDIAQQVGSNRRSVVRVMEQLYATRGLARRGRKYEIVDKAKLLSVVSADVPNLIGTSDERPWGERH